MIRITVIIFLSLLGCSNKKTEYFSNGNIQKEYYLKNGILNGEYLTYFNNGNIKSIDLYANGKRIDSTIVYDSLNTQIYEIKYWSPEYNNGYYIKQFIKNQLSSEGLIIDSIKSGDWKYYKNGKLDQIFEYTKIKGKQYSNQGWVFGNNGKIIKNKGNYYNFKIEGKLVKDKKSKIVIDYKPLISLNSSLIFLLGKNINSDFSNINSVKLDTVYGSNNRIEFNFTSEDTGKINFRGIIKEYVNLNPKLNDSIDYKERVVYLNRELYVNED